MTDTFTINVSPSKQIILRRGSLIDVSADAVVTAANVGLSGGGGVDGAVHRGAGPELMNACREIPTNDCGQRCPVGEARITPGFRLSFDHVIHCVGPVWSNGKAEAQASEKQLLSATLKNVLNLAEAHSITSLSFPLISTGAFRFPIKIAAELHLQEFLASLEQAKHLRLIVLSLLDKRTFTQCQRVFEQWQF